MGHRTRFARSREALQLSLSRTCFTPSETFATILVLRTVEFGPRRKECALLRYPRVYTPRMVREARDIALNLNKRWRICRVSTYSRRKTWKYG